MRVLDGSHLSKLLKHEQVLFLSRLEIGVIECSGPSISNICLIDASHNNLQFLDVLWYEFPSAWWIDVSFNQISGLNYDTLPYVLGSLNLSSNEIGLENLYVLRSINILRLTLIGKAETDASVIQSDSTYRIFVVNLLSNIWVLDDDYISQSERFSKANIDDSQTVNGNTQQLVVPGLNDSLDFKIHQQVVQQQKSVPLPVPETEKRWGTRVTNEREISILRLIQSISLDGLTADYCRLDVLLEDYLEEMRLTNEFHRRNLTIGNKEVILNVNMLQLLSIPKGIRLDLSVLLTAAVLFPLPKQLFKDSLLILLSSHLPLHDILSYCSLPAFIYTAIVSIIRRICKKEFSELNETKLLSIKPTLKEFPHHSHEILSGCSTTPIMEDYVQGDDKMFMIILIDVNNDNSGIVITSVISLNFIASFMSPEGFNHLRPFRVFLERPILQQYQKDTDLKSFSRARMSLFTDLEMEILQQLPDIPTRATRPPIGDQTGSIVQ